jgi:hypothetical protein
MSTSEMESRILVMIDVAFGLDFEIWVAVYSFIFFPFLFLFLPPPRSVWIMMTLLLDYVVECTMIRAGTTLKRASGKVNEEGAKPKGMVDVRTNHPLLADVSRVLSNLTMHTDLFGIEKEANTCMEWCSPKKANRSRPFVMCLAIMSILHVVFSFSPTVVEAQQV